jgi:hypothetical protein
VIQSVSHHRIPLLLIVLGCCLAGRWPAESYGQTQYVQPVNWARYAGKTGLHPGDIFGTGMSTLVRNEERYELNWLTTQPVSNNIQGWEGNNCYYPQFSPSYSIIEAVRPLAAIAYGTAVQIKTGIHSPTMTGVSEADAIQRAEMAIRGVAFSHYSNHANPISSNYWWGGTGSANANNPRWHSSQTYGPQTAEAAWLLWDYLSNDTKLAVAKMMQHEANYVASQIPLYWANKYGTILTPGDTQAEENAWCGHELVVAQAMMPNHPNAPQWREKASQWMVASYCRQSDLTNNTVVDGKPVKDYLNGFNVFPDGVVVNHNMIHPDYMACDAARYAGMIETALAGQYAMQSMVFNADLEYRALTELQFTPGPDTKYGSGKTIRVPGGTIFPRTSDGRYVAELYYPNGNDWTTKAGGHFNMDLFGESLGLDAGKDFDAMGWAQARVDALLELQNRPGHNGNVYEYDDWNTHIRDPDEDFFAFSSQAWMQWWMMQNNLYSPVSDHWGALPAPEPSGLVLTAVGLCGLLAYALRRNV